MMNRICLVVFFAFMALPVLVAQESTAPMVAIPLMATDSHHRPISLTVQTLAITDQKAPVTGASLSRGADLPIELGLLIDDSNSQRSAELNGILKAAKQFVTDSIRNPEDRVFLLDFDATSRATEWLTREQSQTTGLRLRIGGGTALYDAVAMACKERLGQRDWRKPTRRVLVLISDGEDNSSHVTLDEAISEALRTGAVVFTIDTEHSDTPSTGVKIMASLAEETGGEHFSQVGRGDGAKVFATIKAMVDGMYYVRYVPPDVAKSAVHEVEVKRATKERFQLSYARKYFWNQ